MKTKVETTHSVDEREYFTYYEMMARPGIYECKGYGYCVLISQYEYGQRLIYVHIAPDERQRIVVLGTKNGWQDKGRDFFLSDKTVTITLSN